MEWSSSANVARAHDDEIDLIELFQTLWAEKWKIIGATLLAGLICGIYQSVSTPSYESTSVLHEPSDSFFYKYQSVNQDLEALGLSYTIDAQVVFKRFVSEFNSYKSMVDSIQRHEPKRNKNIDDHQYELGVIEQAKRFRIEPPEKEDAPWLLTFNWPDADEGMALLGAATTESIANVKQSMVDDLTELSEGLVAQQGRKVDALQAKIKALSGKSTLSVAKQIEFLSEQSSIARQLGIASNQLDLNVAAQSNNNVSLSVETSASPYYLRGYEAIEKERALLSGRSEEQQLLMLDEYQALRAGLLDVQNSTAPAQVQGFAKMLQADDEKQWTMFNLALSDVNSTRRPILSIVLAMMLMGLVSSIFVLIAQSIKARQPQAPDRSTLPSEVA